MSRIIAVRSVVLSSATAHAWKENRVVFAARSRSTNAILSMDYDIILNLGNSTFQPSRPTERIIWNHGADIAALLWPGASRKLFSDLMPAPPTSYPADVWIKTPGSKGRGHFHKRVEYALTLPAEWDVQAHITGQEYRLITVGHRLVQQMKRHGPNGDRSYEWQPMADISSDLKSLARKAARRVPGRNVLAFDLIRTPEGASYLLEANACPGVNVPTAGRIITEMERTPCP